MLDEKVSLITKTAKNFNFKEILVIILNLIFVSSMAQQKISRKDLLTAAIDSRTVSKVDIKEVIMEVGQTAPYHQHPCPVVGYVAAGTLLFQIEGEPTKTIKQGEAFFEPANTPILHFDNASKTEALKFIAYYLIDKEKELIEMLPQRQEQ